MELEKEFPADFLADLNAKRVVLPTLSAKFLKVVNSPDVRIRFREPCMCTLTPLDHEAQHGHVHYD